MNTSDASIRRQPMGEGGGSGGGGGGAGVPAPKPPNAFAPAAAGQGLASAPASEPPKSKIQSFNQALGGKRHGENWKRKTNLTGSGATHVRSFHCKLNGESLEYMDQQINEWLDNHPDYEVKLVTTAVGEWTGKIKEPAMVVSVWV